MKLQVSNSVILLAFMCLISAYSEINLEGRWISTRIDNPDDNLIGEGWVIVFNSDGTYSEEVDDGFGVVDENEGTYSIQDGVLTLRPSTSDRSWGYSLRKDSESLVIASIWKGKTEYTVFFKQSDEAHPELSKLPRQPKSKEEAVSVLKQKLSEEDLNKLGDSTRDNLVKYHFGLGTYIRNAFGIWGGNKALWDDLTGGEPMHPDNLSGIIIEALWVDLKKQRGNYEEYLALEKLYSTLEIEAFPIREMHPEKIAALLDKHVDAALQNKHLDPDKLNLVLKGVDPERKDARVKSLSLLKEWGKPPREKVLLQDCLGGFSTYLKTPNILEIDPTYVGGWYLWKMERNFYDRVTYQDDYFDVATEISPFVQDNSSCCYSMPGTFSCSQWTMFAEHPPLDWEQMLKLVYNELELELEQPGKIMEFSIREARSGEPRYWYSITSYVDSKGDYVPDEFSAVGFLPLINDIELRSVLSEDQFTDESKWNDLSIAPKLSRKEVISKATDYLKAELKITGEVIRADVSLMRANFTDYWLYEVVLEYSRDSNVANLVTAHVMLNGDVVPLD